MATYHEKAAAWENQHLLSFEDDRSEEELEQDALDQAETELDRKLDACESDILRWRE